MARAKILEIFCGIRLSRARTPRTPVKAHAALNGRVAKSVRVAFQILRALCSFYWPKTSLLAWD
jgi:hypothetical protein